MNSFFNAGSVIRGLSLVLLAMASAACQAQASPPAKTEITLMRFFGSCEAKYGKLIDTRQAVGECGIITTLVNEFNATNRDGIVVKTQIAEWGPYYDQITARLVARDVPTVAVMHESLLGDYVRRKLVSPLDEGFRAVGVNPADFTDHARRGVTFDGVSYALPFDTWSWLWHFNMNLMRQAGLVNADGSPKLPHSEAELFAHARQFKAATGKPYFAWAAANEPSANTRTFLTLLYQMQGQLFAADGRRIDMQIPQARQALDLMLRLYREGHVKPNQDYAGAQQSFLGGEVGVNIIGTWTIDQFMAEARKTESPLYAADGKGYAVTAFPQLFGRQAAYADGHAWVMFNGLRGGGPTPAQRQAGFKLLKFFYDRNLEWARTGHLPTRNSVANSTEFQRLPFRGALAEITHTGVSVPNNVPTQRAVEALVGEDISNLLVSGKPMDAVLANIDKRVNAALKRARR
jgi:multiple sugar transport system substrate-binding protein